MSLRQLLPPARCDFRLIFAEFHESASQVDLNGSTWGALVALAGPLEQPRLHLGTILEHNGLQHGRPDLQKLGFAADGCSHHNMPLSLHLFFPKHPKSSKKDPCRTPCCQKMPQKMPPFVVEIEGLGSSFLKVGKLFSIMLHRATSIPLDTSNPSKRASSHDLLDPGGYEYQQHCRMCHSAASASKVWYD